MCSAAQRQLLIRNSDVDLTTVVDEETLVDVGTAAVLYAIFMVWQVNTAVTKHVLLQGMPLFLP